MNHTRIDPCTFGNTTSRASKREAAAKLVEYLRTHPEPITATDRIDEYTPISGSTHERLPRVPVLDPVTSSRK